MDRLPLMWKSNFSMDNNNGRGSLFVHREWTKVKGKLERRLQKKNGDREYFPYRKLANTRKIFFTEWGYSNFSSLMEKKRLQN